MGIPTMNSSIAVPCKNGSKYMDTTMQKTRKTRLRITITAGICKNNIDVIDYIISV